MNEIGEKFAMAEGKMKAVFPNTRNSRCSCAVSAMPFEECLLQPCKGASVLLTHLNMNSKYYSLVLLLKIVSSI